MPVGSVQAAGSEYATWTITGAAPAWGGTVNAGILPEGTLTSDSSLFQTATSATLTTATPFGARFGSSSGKQYLRFGYAGGSGAPVTPSTTTITFPALTPAPPAGWGFALGDIDAEAITIAATGPGGELTAAQLGWQGAFNYTSGGTDKPVWNPVTRTLSGNGIGTDGASGWFMPSAPITSLTITFTALSGFPNAQMWLAADLALPGRTISGTVTDLTPGSAGPSAGNTVWLYDSAANLVDSATTDGFGFYEFTGRTPADYTVKIVPGPGLAVVGPSFKPADTRAGNVTGVDFTVAVPPAPTTTAITGPPSTVTVGQLTTVTGYVRVSESATVPALTGTLQITGLGSGCSTTEFIKLDEPDNRFAFSCTVTPTATGAFAVTAAYTDVIDPGTGLPAFGSSAVSALVQVVGASPPQPGPPQPPPAVSLPAPQRIGGSDRIQTAIAVSQGFFGSARIVYIATDADFADALVAGPPAGLENAPVLLTKPNELPAAVAAEIQRLNPDEIVIVGGTAAVSELVEQQLAALAPTITRIGGPNRYATAAQLAHDRIGGSGGMVFVATGLQYPDALAAGVPAGREGVPILLVTNDAVPPATAVELQRRQATSAVVVGGVAAVSPDVVDQLSATVTALERVGGVDRYATAAAMAGLFTGSSRSVFMVTGANFPDALSAVPAAITVGSALLLTRPACLPIPTSTELRRLQPTRVSVIGGTAAVADSVMNYTQCS